MSRWLVTGGSGMLAADLAVVLRSEGEIVVALDQDVLDVTDEAAVRSTVGEVEPDVVVNCAAWTDVDNAEQQPEAAMAVNGGGARNIARSCRELGSVLVHISTDYVFAGDAGEPYDEDAPTAPVNVYGATKLAGERAVLEALPSNGYVLRTAWLYGEHGANFVTTMIRLARERDSVDVITDQTGQPTWTADVAQGVLALVRAGPAPGVYQITNAGQATRYEQAREVFAGIGADPARVRPTDSVAMAHPARRPAFSVLGHRRWLAAGLPAPRDWRAALHAALPALAAGASTTSG